MTRRRIEIDGKFYRYRRGKLVQIPDKWVQGLKLDPDTGLYVPAPSMGLTYPQTIRKRPSKKGMGKSWTKPVARKAHKRNKYRRPNHEHK